ncbi:MAG: phosphotransferase [Deltaproteobacteria bacterium]|nr:phosphotransferase [Deltaproteobacteria bacterium]
MNIQPDLKDRQLTTQIQAIVEKQYDLGALTRIKEIFGGFVNRSYAVWIGQHGRAKKFFMREYNPNIAESEIRFEHALLNHLRENGLDIVSGVIPCRDGSTFVKTSVQGRKATYWGLFEFLEGDDPYTWVKTDLTDAEFVSAAKILAQMHHAGRDFFKPEGADRAQPRIMEFIATFKSIFSDYALQAGDRRCDMLFKTNKAMIFSVIDGCIAADKNYGGMLEVPVHCDYHPGNLKYKNEKGVGIFDFDWSKIDYRVFDVALALVYFTSEWNQSAAGSLRMDKFALFLQSYNKQCTRLDGIEPLTQKEREGLIPMLATGNLYVLNWDLMDFYGTENVDDDEYYTYIEHNILLMHWIETHFADISQVIQRVCP